MQVAEKFISINGEGAHAGEPAVFIRFKGCNLSCSYCDTSWANRPDVSFSDEAPEDILKYILQSGIKNVTLTGGEPLLQKELPLLLKLLYQHKDIRIEIETNGSVDISGFISENRPVFTMDYKLPSSGCENHMFLPNFGLLTSQDSVKFVSGSASDLKRALEIIQKYGLSGKCHIFFSPVFGLIEPYEIVDFMLKHKLNNTRIQLQMHKHIWDPDTKGV